MTVDDGGWWWMTRETKAEIPRCRWELMILVWIARYIVGPQTGSLRYSRLGNLRYLGTVHGGWSQEAEFFFGGGSEVPGRRVFVHKRYIVESLHRHICAVPLYGATNLVAWVTEAVAWPEKEQIG